MPRTFRSPPGLLIAGLLIVGLQAPAAAQPWRFVDANGHVTYTNHVNSLPPRLRAKARAQLRRKRLRAAGLEPAPRVERAPREPRATAYFKPDGDAAYEAWRKQIRAARHRVEDLQRDLKAATAEAAEARRAAAEDPTPQARAAHRDAEARVRAIDARLVTAKMAWVDVRRAVPPAPPPRAIAQRGEAKPR